MRAIDLIVVAVSLLALKSTGCGSSMPGDDSNAATGSAGETPVGGVSAAGGSSSSSAGTGNASGSGGAYGSAGDSSAGVGGVGDAFPTCLWGSGLPSSCPNAGEECLDMSPCPSGGCKRDRYVCMSGAWVQDGSDGCGFPCEDGEPPTSCTIDDVTGIYQASYIRVTGDCSYAPGGSTPLEAGAISVVNDTCSLGATKVSADRCNIRYSVSCEDGMGASAEWSYSVDQVTVDAAVLEGTATLTLVQGMTNCTSTFAVRFDLMPSG